MSRCPEVRAVLTTEEAAAVVDPYFLAVREVFVAAGATKCKKVRLEVAPWLHDSPRHFAATENTGRLILVSPEFTELPEGTLMAILAHEFGHATDFLYPAEFLLIDDGELVRMPAVPPGQIDDKHAAEVQHRRMRAWDRIHSSDDEKDKDTVEKTADLIAELFTGHTIGYSGPCELQCFDRGRRPRRAGLR